MLHYIKLEKHTADLKPDDVNYEELLKNVASVLGDKNKYEDLKQDYNEKEEK